jgi:hypothetical protein
MVCRIQIAKLLIKQCYPDTSYFLPLRSTCMYVWDVKFVATQWDLTTWLRRCVGKRGEGRFCSVCICIVEVGGGV